MLFEFIRKLTIPFNEIAKYVPNNGKILDVGCGHGAFSRMMAQRCPQLSVLGIDPSDYKITIAKSKSLNITNLRYRTSYLKNIHTKFDCIVIMDVLYLFPPNEKIKTLQLCYKLLNKNGVLILSEIDNRQNLMFRLLFLEEILMVKILKYTYSDNRGLFFLDGKNYLKEFKKIGFKIISKKTIRGALPYQHILYVGKK
ncbi:MAG: class I SAM-dependent methyltransferase [Candidatus Daviesbacteria bacterium]|nr:class I SAM-dependent methyltransferase [Candidatus Daviesbacteria bacterium]